MFGRPRFWRQRILGAAWATSGCVIGAIVAVVVVTSGCASTYTIDVGRLAGDGPAPTESLASIDDLGFTGYKHSTGAFGVDVPTGWEIDELDGAVAQVVIAPSVDRYQTEWAVDGVYISVVEARDSEVIMDLAAHNVAAAECAEIARVSEETPAWARVDITYDCADGAAVAVQLEWRGDAEIGIVVMSQHDADPSLAVDQAVLSAIIESLTLA